MQISCGSQIYIICLLNLQNKSIMCLQAHLMSKIMYMVIHKQNDCRQNHANLEFCEVCLQALSKNLSISKIKAIHKKGKQIDL